MIRRATVVYIIVLLALVGAYYYLKNRPQKAEEFTATPEPTEQVEYLFAADEGVPTSIRIESKAGETVELARGSDSAWALNQPTEAKADQGSSEAAATQVSTMRVLEKLPTLDPEIAGLKSPEYVLTIKFNGGGERTVNIGVVTPSESGYYVQAASGGDVMIVSKSAIDALLMLLTSPPYLETLTPSPTGTETPMPSATPEPVTPLVETSTPAP
jgi:hypothetical protein